MGKRYDAAMKVKPLYQKGAQSLSDKEALEVKGIYAKWEELIGTEAEMDMKFSHGEKLYRVISAHTFSAEWEPGIGTESLYVRIDEEHEGTIDDPIPYEGNMILMSGLYYTQNDVIYLCIRDTGIAVHNPLADLVGLYVEVADG